MSNGDEHDAVRVDAIPCCPELDHGEVCDTLDLRYRLPWRRERGRVDVILHFRLERCSGAMALGDLAYTTTLFPGERVRLFTHDRHTRWSYDAETELAYRHRTTSEESYYTWGMARAMSDLSVSESGSASSSYDEDWASGGGGASFNFLGIIEIGGGGGGGSFDADSSSSFARNLSRHAESSSSYVAAGVRARSSTSVGEVEQRQHAEGESETHLESSSRVFHNPNRCHAVTYYFYKINKEQVIRFRLVAIERVAVDPAAPSQPDRTLNPDLAGHVAVRPETVRATAKDRLEVERTARQAALERQQATIGVVSGGVLSGITARRAAATFTAEPVSLEARQGALKAVDRELAEAGLLDAKTGEPTEKIVAELSWERREWLPTPGLMVKSCLDECDACEPALARQIELELERHELENELLRRRIELLDQAAEYRCCPEGESEDEDDD
jgi:hypothetical protein